jgi:diguanylate cyclase (GGDEF)-like protein
VDFLRSRQYSFGKDQKVELETILEKLEQKEREFISTLIEKDPLTGVYNRRKFDNDIELLISMSDRTTMGCALLIIDIDNFKDFNDKYGHFEGDLLLKKVTNNIQLSIRSYDKIHFYRYGGEEFVIIIPDTTANEALTIGERLRKNVKGACDVTISVGVSHYKELAGNINELINNADKALYKAKRAGKDKVSLYEKTA